MKPIKQYVADELQVLVNDFPNIQVSCQYDARGETYCVKVLPEIFYTKDIAFTYRTAYLLDDLLSLYPNESIVFFSEDSTIKIDKADYIISGKNFATGSLVSKGEKAYVSSAKRKRKDVLQTYTGRAV